MSLASKGWDCDVLVLGASFAGIEVVRRLAGRSLALSIEVVDRQLEHGYLPLVHERLCGRIPVAETALPTADYLRAWPHVRFTADTVVAFDPATHEVTLASGGRRSGRFVVVALGSDLVVPAGISGRERVLTHKSTADFEYSRTRLNETLRGGEAPHLVVVGGGISGVELVAELAAPAPQRRNGWSTPKTVLIETADRLLAQFSAPLSRRVHTILQDLGVTVMTSTRLESVPDGAVVVRHLPTDAVTTMPAAMVFWTGGIAPAPVLSQLGLPTDPHGWIRVRPTLQPVATATSAADGRIFACGDAVRIESDGTPWATMQRAIECLWQAKTVAQNLTRLARRPDGETPDDGLVEHPFRPDFPYGISLGPKSLIVVGDHVVDQPWINTWFRRFLMKRYFARYRKIPGR